VGIQQYRQYVTETRIERLSKALSEYVIVRQRFPCAASPSDDEGVATHGLEIQIPGGCDAVRDAVLDGAVHIGAFPINTIIDFYEGLTGRSAEIYRNRVSLKDTYDAWGGRITYAVSVNLTVSGSSYDDNPG